VKISEILKLEPVLEEYAISLARDAFRAAYERKVS
jgi:hypothetical protein